MKFLKRSVILVFVPGERLKIAIESCTNFADDSTILYNGISVFYAVVFYRQKFRLI